MLLKLLREIEKNPEPLIVLAVLINIAENIIKEQSHL